MTARLLGSRAQDAALTSGGPNSLLVSNERVWLSDLSLPAGAADPTGAADCTAAIQAALTKAATTTYGRALVGAAPGNYKCLSSLYSVGGVGIDCLGRAGAAAFYFPNETGKPALAFTTGALSAGATSVPYQRLEGTFFAASALTPQTVMINSQVCTYTGVTISTSTTGTLTGVSGLTGGAGSLAVTIVQGCAMHFGKVGSGPCTILGEGVQLIGPRTGTRSTWNTSTPPNGMDGVYMDAQTRINCQVGGFRAATLVTTDHQIWGTSFKGTCAGGAGNWALIYMAKPEAVGGGGDQLIEDGCHLDAAYRAAIYLDASTALQNLTTGKCHIYGAPVGIEKGNLRGDGNDYAFITNGGIWNGISFEQIGLRIIGSDDAKSTITDLTIIGARTSLGPSFTPAGQTPGALVMASISGGIWDCKSLLTTLWATSPSYIQGDNIAPRSWGDLSVALNNCNALNKPFAVPATLATANVGGNFENGVGQRGLFANPVSGQAIYRFDVVGFSSGTAVERLQRNPSAVAGIAALPSAYGHVPLIVAGGSTFPVNVNQQSTPPTSPAASVSGTPGSLPANTYVYKVAAILSGGGETGPSTEVSVTLSGSNSAALSWVAPTGLPHGQSVIGYRAYRGTAPGAETGYFLPGNVLLFTDSGSALTTKAPGTQNVGCEVYGAVYVRPDSAHPGVACIASGWTDTAGQPFAFTFAQPDNGITANVHISPALA